MTARAGIWRGYPLPPKRDEWPKTTVRDEWIECVTVLFEDGTADGDIESRRAFVDLLRRQRGVAKVVPSSEVSAGHLQWRELVKALDVDHSEDEAHDLACRNATAEHSDLERATRLVNAFTKIATEGQMKELAPLWLAPTWQDRQFQIEAGRGAREAHA